MDLEQVHLSLASVLALLAFLASGVAGVMAWLAKSAYKAERELLRLELQQMKDATKLAHDDARKAREETRANEARIVDLEKRNIHTDGKLLGIEKTATEAVDEASEMRASMVSKEYLAAQFATQNVTLAHQNQQLADIKSELGRKVSVANMPATRARDDRREPESKPPR